ncbi:Methionine gamma-lyase 2 [Monocercomonoides exilis]|uniref:Methionine gamma-lyase 2 n=1 Tax=Monocercomonoides exilis TaxID=2049356 RepID=UPI003559715B|nr:Methionine gamma-lyase 2 [Monocercomonoides exilis]|eukprot:MONOS_12120.1-p1 / transcript=MONOS_12120.1 / gene=MONOS_12120 / organism=Monocercomonoides_exilis_PA203 / gene_product=Methionine gamma-lyase 2 / transcript_product=Methionine gamma-lyase 2 / location=Mono_scaffold00648:14794-15987(+) / protein_length=398 / sequence_SO=supercontig / SO=protein_coding / is_pseudo=false
MAAKQPSIETLVLHADGHDKPLKSHANPIFQTSSFVFDSPEHGRQLFAGEEKGHIYSRIGNPTIETFEKMMTVLEQGSGAVAFSSGMAAIMGCTLPHLRAGDHLIIGDTLYGPSTTMLTGRYEKFGIETAVVDTSEIENVKAAFKPNTKLVFLETPANPTGKLSDVEAISEIAHGHHALVAVDATFSSPYNFQPLLHGADLVAHSLTKYINGHGDVVGGVVTCKTPEIATAVRNWRKDTGSILGPFDAWLVIRGLRTLPVRMERHNKNAKAVAEFLRSRPEVSKVMYPGFEDFPHHDVAVKQMREGCYGSTFSFCMKGGYDAAKKLLENLHLCTVAVSLGNTDTLIEHPASMTHASVPEELMKKQGLTKDLIRISVGLENVDEIIDDLKHGLEIVGC